jgi:hypothetical protein
MILFAVVAASKVLNLITKHWSEHSGIVKVCLFLIDVLDLVKTTPRPGQPRNGIDIKPGTMILMLIISFTLIIVSVQGCTTVDGQKKFDACQAMTIAQNSHMVADGASGIVCAMLQGEKRAQCIKHREKVKAAADAMLSIAATMIKACKL